MKKLISILTVGVMICGLSACSKKEDVNNNKQQIHLTSQKTETQEMTHTAKSTTEPITEAPRLSDEFDKILCSAQDGEDYYEMVANQTEDYSGVKTEIGVIKNNQWIQPMTSNHPFIDKENTMLGKYVDTLHDNFTVEYLGNGCFYYYSTDDVFSHNDAFYNANNNKSYSFYLNSGDYTRHDKNLSYTYCVTTEKKANYIEDSIRVLPKNNSGKIIVDFNCASVYTGGERKDQIHIKTLDLLAMKVSDYRFWPTQVGAGYTCYPYAEDLFAVCAVTSDNTIVFYDLNGNCVIDLSNYKITHIEQAFFFENGLCSFNIINDNDTEYKITIDKTGQVVYSEQL